MRYFISFLLLAYAIVGLSGEHLPLAACVFGTWLFLSSQLDGEVDRLRTEIKEMRDEMRDRESGGP